MKLEVEVISSEIIKPSSPTPEHLRHYELSFLDQLSPKSYNPLILFYELDDDQHNIIEISNKIKNSLSEVLTLFYPLAGRVKKDRFVDCNDDGVSYSVARVDSTCHLSDAIKNLPPSELCNFLPFQLHELTEFSLGVQVNIFESGGIALGICVSHLLADALSSVMFVKTWVAVSRGDVDRITRPEFVTAKLFPLLDDPKFDPNTGITRNVIAKRFVFEGSVIEAIRSKYEEKAVLEGEKRPSRVEALSAFIFSRFTAAMASSTEEHSAESEKVYAVLLPVNLRQKLDPPLPEHSFGNLYRYSYAMLTSSTLSTAGEENYSYEVVKQIREGIKKVNMDYLKKVQGGVDSHLEFLKESATELSITGGKTLIEFCITSLCRFPVYDADFGWGKPIWVGSSLLPFNNLVSFLDTKTGNGIEAYIELKEELMAKLENDKEFIKVVSPH